MSHTKKLKASKGKNTACSLDSGSMQKIKHCQELIERTLGVKPSNTVIIRRAISALCSIYDDIIRDKTNLEENMKEEQWNLEYACRGRSIKYLYPVTPTSEFPVFSDRIPKGGGSAEFLHSLTRGSLKA